MMAEQINQEALLEHPETRAYVQTAARKMFAYASLYLGLAENPNALHILFGTETDVDAWYIEPRIYRIHKIITSVQVKQLGWFSFDNEEKKKELAHWALERATQYHALLKQYGINPMSSAVIHLWKSYRKW